MADWRNRITQISNKVKHQLNAKGVDSIAQLRGVFEVCVFSCLLVSVSQIQIIELKMITVPFVAI